MFKKLLLTTLLIASMNVHAEANTSAKLGTYTQQQPKGYQSFSSYHEYTISNNTANSQNISVCFTLLTCSENIELVRQTRICKSFILPAWKTVSDANTLFLQTNYTFQGGCDVKAVTETTGGTYSIAIDKGFFSVSPY